MVRWSLPFLTLILGFFMLVPDAEARRFGGGMSGGQSYATPQRQAPAAAPQQRQQQNQQANRENSATPAARPGMMGLMGGLMAGGLLAALFMGGAFEGIQLMDILLMALLGFIAFKVIRALRAPASPQPAYAGGQPTPVASEPTSRREVLPEPPVTGGFSNSFNAEPLPLPEWFNTEAFLDGARGHFTHLQAAWDRSDWSEISTYTSAELLSWLQAERSKSTADQHTEVVSVMAELVNFIDEGDKVVASVHFYGWLREEQDGDTTEFSEIWHLNRQMGEVPGDWIIVGIEQPH